MMGYVSDTFLDAILNMVNIAANILGAKTEDDTAEQGRHICHLIDFWNKL